HYLLSNRYKLITNVRSSLMAVNIHITIIELNALHTKRQNLFQELDAVIHLLMEAKHWGLRKSRNATSLNSRFKSLDTLKVKIISVTFRRVIRTNHKKAPRFGGMKTYNWEGVNPDGYFLDKLEPIPSALPSFQKLFQVSATASHFFDLVIGKILTSRLSLSKHLAHNLGNLLLLGKIGVFHNRRNASSRLLLLISKHLILCIYLVFRILA